TQRRDRAPGGHVPQAHAAAGQTEQPATIRRERERADGAVVAAQDAAEPHGRRRRRRRQRLKSCREGCEHRRERALRCLHIVDEDVFATLVLPSTGLISVAWILATSNGYRKARFEHREETDRIRRRGHPARIRIQRGVQVAEYLTPLPRTPIHA